MTQARPFRLAILGGGFTGAAFAVHFLRAYPHAVEIAIFEPRAELGQGVAYGTDSVLHRINVPSDKMFVFDEDREDFSRWMQSSGRRASDPAGETGDGDHYSLRRDFGAYMSWLLDRTVADHGPECRLRHYRTDAENVERLAGGTFWITGADGAVVAADAVLICASHAAPAFPWQGDMDESLPGLVVNPWAPGALDGLPLDGDAFIIGTGLTMADMVVSLDAAGHKGSILAVSRRGLVPSEQGEFASGFDLFGDREPPRTALGLLRLVRWRANELTRSGRAWHAAVDALRWDLPRFWSTLPVSERARLVRHLRAYWDVHRYRMAPQVAGRLARDRAGGRFAIAAGRIDRIGHDGKGFWIDWRPRGSDPAKPPGRSRASVVINCTGPGANPARSRNPLFRSLIGNGLAAPDPLGIGLDVTADGTALDPQGRSVRRLLVAGPLARGRFGETMGVPDASANARMVAEQLARDALCSQAATALAG